MDVKCICNKYNLAGSSYSTNLYLLTLFSVKHQNTPTHLSKLSKLQTPPKHLRHFETTAPEEFRQTEEPESSWQAR